MARQTKEDKEHDKKTTEGDKFEGFFTLENTGIKFARNEGRSFTFGKRTRRYPGVYFSLCPVINTHCLQNLIQKEHADLLSHIQESE